FQVLGSPPLREVFQSAFGLPQEFAAVNIDQQLVDIKARSEQAFGTSDLRTLSQTENIDEIRRRFVALSQINAQIGSQTAQSAALALLQNSAGSGGLLG
ncbi:MAG: DUF1217 domain-containing protein, partial [Pseudomonadota bacterium]